MLDRIKLLEGFIKEDPSDPFNYYALALEYAKKDKHKAIDIFKQLTKDRGDYLPTYYQLAKLYEQVGEIKGALNTYNEGILIARQQNDFKTQQELAAALEQLNED